MPTNSIEVQLQKAIEMKKNVQEFAKELRLRMNLINDELDNYIKMGFPVEIANHYRAVYYEPDRETINNLCKKMENEHVQYMDRLIEKFIEILNRR